MFDLKGKRKTVKERLLTLSSGSKDLWPGTHETGESEIDGWMDTLPSLRADAGEALVVFRFLTYATIFTGSGAAGRQQNLTVFTWWQGKKTSVFALHW